MKIIILLLCIFQINLYSLSPSFSVQSILNQNFDREEKKNILVTYFGPYYKMKEGVPVPVNENASKVVAENVQRLLNQEDFKVDLCQLDTEYFTSTRQAKNCLKTADNTYDYIIGLGQFKSCKLKVESYVYNKDNSKAPDNAGVVRKKKKQMKRGKRKLRLSFIPRDYKMEESDKKLIISSEDPGRYVCNHYAYGMMSYLDWKQTKFSFIHVGGVDCENHDELSEVLARLVQKNI